MWWALSARCGVPPRVLKKRYTAREARDLFVYWQRQPFDDESNYWLPIAMLMAEIRNKFRDGDPVDASHFLPFARRDEEPEIREVVRTVPYTKKHLKRIQKALKRNG